jgi:putative DNA primase/helicase
MMTVDPDELFDSPDDPDPADGPDPIAKPNLAGCTMLPRPSDPLAVARLLAVRLDRDAFGLHHVYWCGDHYVWVGTHWEIRDESAYRKWIYLQAEHAQYVDGFGKNRSWSPDTTKVNKVLDALRTACLLRPSEQEPDSVIACRNGILSIGDTVSLNPHSCENFNLASLPYDFDPEAKCPRWLKFLDEVLPDDRQSQNLLQEFIGYVLSGETSLQKALSLCGPTRCGKGTIARIIGALLGRSLVTSASIQQFGEQFGLADLVGKALCTLPDVRWDDRKEVSRAVHKLLNITGEDEVSINRKFKKSWTGILGTRLLFMGNDPPQFRDTSSALANRLLHIWFPISFLGRENPLLTEELMRELPGILNWALRGLQHLRERGHFVQPESGKQLAQDVLESASPLREFVSDRCVLGQGREETLPTLYQVYCGWAELRGEHPMKLSAFSRELTTAHPELVRDQRGRGTQRVKVILGLSLA